MKRLKRERVVNIISSVSALAAMWLAWTVACACVRNEYVLPSFGQTMKEASALLADALFWRSFCKTLLRVAEAYCISFLLGGACAAAGAAVKPVGAFLKPVVTALRTLPTMAFLLFLILWSSPMVAPLVITSLVLFPMTYSQFAAAIAQIDPDLMQMAEVYRFTRMQKLKYVVLPLAAPYVLSHVGPNLSFGIKITVSAEVMAYTFVSLGGLMQTANANLQTARLAALTLVAVAAGIAAELLFYAVNKMAFGWKKGVYGDRT